MSLRERCNREKQSIFIKKQYGLLRFTNAHLAMTELGCKSGTIPSLEQSEWRVFSPEVKRSSELFYSRVFATPTQPPLSMGRGLIVPPAVREFRHFPAD